MTTPRSILYNGVKYVLASHVDEIQRRLRVEEARSNALNAEAWQLQSDLIHAELGRVPMCPMQGRISDLGPAEMKAGKIKCPICKQVVQVRRRGGPFTWAVEKHPRKKAKTAAFKRVLPPKRKCNCRATVLNLNAAGTSYDPVVIENDPHHRGQTMKHGPTQCTADPKAIAKVLNKKAVWWPMVKAPESGCGGPQESCIPCKSPEEHEASRCPECGVHWCDECSTVPHIHKSEATGPKPGDRLDWSGGEAPASHGTYRMRGTTTGPVSLTYQKKGSKKETVLEKYDKGSVFAKAEACHMAAQKHHDGQKT